VLVVVGARPNFVKVAPVVHVLAALGVDTPVVNTGWHYDRALVGVFLHDERPICSDAGVTGSWRSR
jgi:UDP-N-acetylglucosamine 2-epimerase (non-hydrolysing)